MIRRIFTLMILSLLVMAFLGMTAMAASSPQGAKRVVNPHINKVMQYALPYADENLFSVTSSAKEVGDHALGAANPPASGSPGYRLGGTWYDYQHNGRIPRMVTWGYDATNGFIIHFNWMYMPTSALADRANMYTAWLANSSAQLANVVVQPSGDYAGYVGGDVTRSTAGAGANRAVPYGHNNQGAGYSVQTYWDFSPAFGFFGTTIRVPDAVQCYQVQTGKDYCAIWPSAKYQDVPGQTPVLHIFAQTSMPNAADPQAIYYFRKVGIDNAGTFDSPPKVLDTVFDISQEVCCSYTNGKVALVWIANRCPNLTTCDTCSDNSGNEAVFSVQLDNDIYYKLSSNYGATWSPRVNMTKNRKGVAGYRPYTDLSAMINSAGNLVVCWSGRVWPADPEADGVGYDCRLFAWSEALGFNTTGGDGKQRVNMRTVQNCEWDQTTCNGGAWQMNLSKMQISECNNRLYAIWVQFNDIPNGIEDDCAQRGIDGSDVVGSANGELYLSVCNDLTGLLWDAARDLTTSRTPGCDSANGLGGRCDSDHWPSMAEMGTNYAANVNDSIKLDPSGSYTGGYYLPVQYICDPVSGGIVQSEGTWANADVVWFQLACVPPVETKILVVHPNEIAFPAWTKPSTTKCTTVVIENTGNANFNWTATKAITSGHPAGAFTVTPSSGTLNAGLSNSANLNFCFGNGLVTTEGELVGTVTFTGTFTNTPLVMPIHFFFADTIIFPKFDTIYAGNGAKANVLALTYGNNGNLGNQGKGDVNLDYFNYGDCDVYDPETQTDPYLGNSQVYLYDASMIVCWMDVSANPDTVACNYSMFDHTWLSGGYYPDTWPTTPPAWLKDFSGCGHNVGGAVYFNRDTSLMFEQWLIAPNAASYAANAQFMIEACKISNLSGGTISGLAIGEGIDWDIPSDSGSWNNSGFDIGRKLIYQQGSEFNQDATECQNNNLRYGGIAVLEIKKNTTTQSLWGMYTMDNSTQVYPAGHFVPDSLWKYMQDNTGYTVSDSTDADLHTVATYAWNASLGASDSYTIYSLLVTSKDGNADFLAAVDAGIDFFQHCVPSTCCQQRGDVDNNGVGPDISDLVALVGFMFGGQPYPGCEDAGYKAEADIDGSGTGPDISDLVALVNYMFGGCPSCLVPCP